MIYNIKVTTLGNFNFLCLFTHKWTKVKASATTVYWMCDRCGRKEMLQRTEEYPPRDILYREDL